MKKEDTIKKGTGLKSLGRNILLGLLLVSAAGSYGLAAAHEGGGRDAGHGLKGKEQVQNVSNAAVQDMEKPDHLLVLIQKLEDAPCDNSM